MLQIKNIRKVYKTGSLVQEALGGVSLSLRDNEFVAILGPSGSGKTTLLNIIGGLDRYDDGDLIINGISTKKYSDRNWDAYRNHTVGFVFQSYNLIPHQTILKNVELALTISGVSSRQRTARATEALEKVGLKDHIHKRPSQLSGGQMQRVAIARALVNDPDILLADEPTGALDSETSIQVMALLKEVAGDRLVVMVTHNPELAEAYATRIVTLKDGGITSDSDPYEPDEGEAVHKSMGRSSMSFLTALALSFNNLRTKKARTILVSFAGSIGIIGIAMILSLSHGATQYIHNIEEESLQSYPLTISDTNFDFTSIYTDSINSEDDDEKAEVTEMRYISGLLSGVKNNDLKSLRAYFESDDCDIYDYVQSLEYGYRLIPQIYKKYESGYRQVNPDKSIDALGFFNDDSMVTGIVSSFSSTTTFNPLPAQEKIYTESYEVKAGRWPENYDECVVVLTINGKIPDTSLYNLGLKDPAELDKLIKAYSENTSTRVEEDAMTFDYDDFLGIEFKLISATEYYTYDKKNKIWVDRSDDTKAMAKLLDKSESMRVVGVVQPKKDNMSPILVQGICYHSSITDHMIELSKDSDIVKAQKKDPKTDVFTGKAFGEKDTKADFDVASLFSVDESAVNKAFDTSSLDIDIPEMDLGTMDFSDVDLEDSVSDYDFSADFPTLSKADIEEMFNSINFTVTADSMKTLFKKLIDGYTEYTKDKPEASVSNLPEAFAKYITSEDARNILIEDLIKIAKTKAEYLITVEDLSAVIQSVMEGYPEYLTENGLSETVTYSHIVEYLQSEKAKELIESGVTTLREKLSKLMFTDEEVTSIANDLVSGYEPFAEKNNLPTSTSLLNAFTEYITTDSAQSLITDTISGSVDTDKIEKTIKGYTNKISDKINDAIGKMISAVESQITSSLEAAMSTFTGSISEDMLSGFTFDTSQLSKLIRFNMTVDEIKNLMSSLLISNESNYESNLRKMGYADIDKPSSITIYPADFDSKSHIKELIDDYNTRMIEEGNEDKVVEYTDLVDALMGTVTIIIDVISYILIAFVAISLVVSSIMIGVITYISVLERRKEIGILRAIGASKHNISSVFNAETFIIGTLAGLFGIGITELLIIPTNLIIHAASGQNGINAILPPLGAVILILLSIVLTLIGGIIPSRKAAKSDPVTALRSE